MKKLSAHIGASLTLLILPVIAAAQVGGGAGGDGGGDFSELSSYGTSITSFINSTLIPLVFAVALLVFIFGMYRFFIQGGHDDDSRAKGKQLMIWALVGFVLMVSLFGIVNLIAGGLGFGGDSLEDIPQANFSGAGE